MMFREEKKSFFGKMSQRIGDALAGKATIDDDFMDELEEILITSDIGMETTMKIVDMLRTEVKTNNLTKPSVIKIRLAKIISSVINKKEEQKLCQDIRNLFGQQRFADCLTSGKGMVNGFHSVNNGRGLL